MGKRYWVLCHATTEKIRGYLVEASSKKTARQKAMDGDVVDIDEYDDSENEDFEHAEVIEENKG